MKKFKFKFSPALLVLLSLLIVISVLGTTVNAIRFFNPLLTSYHSVSTIILAVLSLALLVVALLVLFKSKYEFKGGELYFIVGLIKIKLGAKSVLAIRELKNKTLYLVFSDAKFTIVLISPKQFDDFSREIKKINPKVLVESVNEEE